METIILKRLGDKVPVHAEATEWNPPDVPRWNAKQPKRSRTRMAIDALKVGECIRLYHPDVACSYGLYGSCSIASIISTKRRDFCWEIEAYHEDRYIAVVRRIA